MIRYTAVVAACVVALALGATWFFSQSANADQFAECRASTVAGDPEIGGPFTLVNGDGQTVTDADVITEPTIIYFGYTFCPDVCPIDSARNAEAVDILNDRGRSATPVFITIDPDRDTPEVVRDYAGLMHEKMIGLTGSAEQIAAVSQAYRTFYRRQPGDDEFYLVDHSTFSYLVMPEHGFVEFFRRDQTAEQIADTVQCFADNA